MSLIKTSIKTRCYHCGEDCLEDSVYSEDKSFCCTGCRMVYEILAENNLCNYYALESQPGNTLKTNQLGDRFAYLDAPAIESKLIRYRDKDSIHLRFHIPGMHCSSCIWLLEHLGKLDHGVQKSTVDFIRKELSVVFTPGKTSIRKIVEMLNQIGYAPELNLEQLEQKVKSKKSRSRIYKIGLAGFAFGNIMLMSFPEYFSGGIYQEEDFRNIFGYLNLLLALPVFFYSGSEFLENALLSIRQRVINIDVPIAIGIVAMFGRSAYEVLTGTGAGYFDSMTGLIFFMLIGRNFQNKTFDWLSFERDYKSYFPIAVSRFIGSRTEPVPVQDIRPNDRLLIRNQEIIPADVILLSERAEIDYSFVTGESNPVSCEKGERLFAGGRLHGSPAEVVVQQEVSSSYLTQLWNQSSMKETRKSGFQLMVESISRWFVIITLLIAASAFIYWYPSDISRAMHAFTSVLVIACACALALSAPFTFGNIIRILGKKGVYLKNASVIEKLCDINMVVFDKTGTLTETDKSTVEYDGDEMNPELEKAVYSLASASSHPLCRILAGNLSAEGGRYIPENVFEVNGKGIEGRAGKHFIRLGNGEFTAQNQPDRDAESSVVYLQVDGINTGVFRFRNHYREKAAKLLNSLKEDGYELAVISGDHSHERPFLEKMTGQRHNLLFEQKPEEKKRFIESQMKAGHKVMMIGDGLNDAGALLISHTGIAIAENVNNFTPGSDGIVLASNFGRLHNLLRFAKASRRIIIISFIISLFYNLAGLYFAVQGTLSPVIAAILMPISTTSLVLYTVAASSLKARQLGFTKGI